mmetsp:Transcript_33560/g.57027  ORF Transcript_33560/g.57027 Transcript_33560/m.57027 type:complete len:436 (+) Transcript_33560:75-1382(+)
MEEESLFDFIIDHDNDIEWDFSIKGWANPMPPFLPRAPSLSQHVRYCFGITLTQVRTWPMRGEANAIADRREKRCLGFKHVVREGCHVRAKLSQPAEDKWRAFLPPISGAVMHGNDDSQICWLIDEHPRQHDDDQFDHHEIRAIDCTREELAIGQQLCAECLKKKDTLIRRFESAVDLQDGAFKIGFQHPHPLFKNRITIVIGGEMPHWGKKFSNAFDNKSCKLTFRGKEMALEIIYEIWKASGDADTSVGLVRRYNKTHDHFKLNAYLKMRVFLALQIPSQNTIGMINDYCDPDQYEDGEEVPSINEFAPMIAIFEKVDRLVDIMNGRSYKNGKDKDVELINSPTHRHIEELFDVLRIFVEWKEETKKTPHQFITSYTYEDLVWMVFGVASVAALYLDEDESKTIHQGRSGSDVCELFFDDSVCKPKSNNEAMH